MHTKMSHGGGLYGLPDLERLQAGSANRSGRLVVMKFVWLVCAIFLAPILIGFGAGALASLGAAADVLMRGHALRWRMAAVSGATAAASVAWAALVSAAPEWWPFLRQGLPGSAAVLLICAVSLSPVAACWRDLPPATGAAERAVMRVPLFVAGLAAAAFLAVRMA